MEHLLTQEIVDGFNEVLIEEGSILRVRFEGTCGYIEFTPDKYVGTSSPSINEEFYVSLNTYLNKQYNLPEAGRNNTWSTFWILG
jgi:hypothetical protein